MASKYRRPESRFWWIRWRGEDGKIHREGTPYRIGIGTDTRAVERKVAQLTVQEKSIRVVARDRNAFSRWVPQFLDVQYAASPRTLTRFRFAWRVLSLWMSERGITSPHQIIREHANDFIAWRVGPKDKRLPGPHHVCRNTAISDLTLMRIVMQESLRRNMVDRNPLTQLRLKLERRKEKQEFTDQQIATIREQLRNEPEWMQASFEIALHQGCRMSETSVPFQDIDLDRGTITFMIKQGRRHTTKLHPRLVPLLSRIKAQGRETTCDLPVNRTQAWHRFFRRIGMKNHSFHCLRVTCITRLARAGVPEGAAARFIGHANITIHRVYQRLTVDDLSVCVAALSVDTPPQP